MKKYILFHFVIISLFIGCKNHTHNESDRAIENALQKVYPIIYENVDSAEIYLQSAAPFVNEASELYRNKYLLAAYQVRNNRWEPLQFTDTLQNLVEYILENGDNNEKMRACYLAGRCFERGGDYLTALEWMQKAWDIVKENKSNSEFDYSIATYIGSKMGFLLKEENACMLAKDYFIENASNSITLFDTLFACNDICFAYFIIEEYDSAKYYANKAFEILQRLPYEPNYMNGIIWTGIEIYEECNEWNEVEKRIPYIIDDSNNYHRNFNLYLLSKWFLHKKNYEKAESLLRQSQLNENPRTSFNILKCYFYLYNEQENKDSALKYAKLCIEYQDTVIKHSDLSQGYVVDRLYNINLSQQKENEALKAKIKAIWVAIVTVISLIFVTMLLIFVRRKYRKITQILKKENLKKDENVAFLKKNMKMMTKNHQNLIDKTKDLMKKEQQRTLPYDYKSVLEQIKLKSLNTNNIEKEDKEKVKEICNHLYPDWESKLETLIPNVSVHHKTVCMLTLLGFNTKMMQNYTQNNKHSLSYSRKYLNEKLSRENNSKEEFLKNTLESIFGPLQD